MSQSVRKPPRKLYPTLVLGLFLSVPLGAWAEDPAAPPAANYPAAYLNFGARFGEENLEGYSDMILPLLNNEQNIIFFNPRVSLMDEGANEFNLGLGYRRMVSDGLVLGGNVFVDSRESAHSNRFNQWGAGVELLSQHVDFRANYYDADNDREKIGEYNTLAQETRSQTSSSTRTSSRTTPRVRPDTGLSYSDPYAQGHSIYYDQYYTTITSYSTTYRTTTTTTTTSKWFEQFEAGMDGWDAELGFKLPLPIGPEVRLFGGYYAYDNPFGEDVDGLKARLEVKTGPYLSLDAEVFEDKTLNGSDFFVGARLQVPLSLDLRWSDFVDGLVSMRHRSLDERMRSEMVQRDVRIQRSQSEWEENLARRKVDVQSRVSTRTSSKSVRTDQSTQVTLADRITFVDKDNAADFNQDGTNEHPYGDAKGGIQKGVDKAGVNSTIFVYEAGGRVNGINRDAGDVGGVYDEQVVMKPGQTITSEIIFTGHPTQNSYATVNRPLLQPSAVTYNRPYGDPLITSQHAAAISMPENTTLHRMAVATSQDRATAVWVQPQLGSGSVRIQNSDLRTREAGSDAVVTYLNQTSLESLTVVGSSISTAAGGVHGVLLLEFDNASLGSLNVVESNLSTTGHSADGIGAYIGSSRLGSLNLAASTIHTTGEQANGLRTVLYGDITGGPATVDSLNVSDTSISTAGEGAYGLNTYLANSSLGRMRVTDSTLSTAGTGATALHTFASAGASGGSTRLASLDLSNNSITTAGKGGNGIVTVLSASRGGSVNLGSLDAAGNSISTASDFSTGFSSWSAVWDDSSSVRLGTVSVTENTIHSTGANVQGMNLGFYENPTSLGNQSIQNNRITVEGPGAAGITISGNAKVSPAAFGAAALESGNPIGGSGARFQKVRIVD